MRCPLWTVHRPAAEPTAGSARYGRPWRPPNTGAGTRRESAVDRLAGRALAKESGDRPAGQHRVERVNQGGVDPGVGGEPPIRRPGDDHARGRAVVDLV